MDKCSHNYTEEALLSPTASILQGVPAQRRIRPHLTEEGLCYRRSDHTYLQLRPIKAAVLISFKCGAQPCALTNMAEHRQPVFDMGKEGTSRSTTYEVGTWLPPTPNHLCANKYIHWPRKINKKIGGKGAGWDGKRKTKKTTTLKILSWEKNGRKSAILRTPNCKYRSTVFLSCNIANHH